MTHLTDDSEWAPPPPKSTTAKATGDALVHTTPGLARARYAWHGITTLRVPSGRPASMHTAVFMVMDPTKRNNAPQATGSSTLLRATANL